MALIYGHWNINVARLGLELQDIAFNSNNNDQNEKSQRKRGPQSHLHNANNTNNDVDAPTYAQSTSVAPHNTNDLNNDDSTRHLAHTQGFAPAHERTTVEGGQHSATLHHDGARV